MERPSVDLLTSQKAVDTDRIDEQLTAALKKLNRKIVVIDDDPTGAQSVHDVYEFTNWNKESFLEGFRDENNMFYILTNSRSFPEDKTIRVHEEVGAILAEASGETHMDYVLVNRSDSTLRGHYPQETTAMRSAIEKNSGKRFDGEILLPFFIEGGRYTIDDVQFVKEGEYLTPAGQTEFARDKTFGYKSSHLGDYVEEKTQGRYKKEDCTYISLADIRDGNIEKIKRQLLAVEGFSKVIVNAVAYSDVKTFIIAFVEAVLMGKEFLFRSATSLTKVIGDISDMPLLTRDQLIKSDNGNGGIVLVGSHVNRTTQQFNGLKSCKKPLEFIEFNQHLVLKENGLVGEMRRVVKEANKHIGQGRNVVVYTRRDRFDLNTDDREKQLEISVKISNAVTGIIARLGVRPNFIIAKGGNTSSDVATKALGIKKALVLGQIKPGIPVWLTGAESKFVNMPLWFFPAT